jgi:hypothetical protein
VSDELIGSCLACDVPLYRESSRWVRTGDDRLFCLPCYEHAGTEPAAPPIGTTYVDLSGQRRRWNGREWELLP